MSSSGYVASALVALVNAVQAGALQLSSNAYLNVFGACTAAANSCLLPSLPYNGQVCKIRNDGAAPLNFFSQVGGTINALAANADYIIPVGAVVEFVSNGSLAWYVSNGLQSSGNSPAIGNAQATAVTGTGALAAKDCGIVNVTSAAANIVITLPAPAVGLNYRICLAATAGSNTVTVTATGVLLEGVLLGAATLLAGNVTSTSYIMGATAVAGDFLDLWCDGAFWHGLGFTNAAGAFTRA